MKEEPIPVEDLRDTEGLEGHYVLCPKYSKVPIYIPKRDANGVPVLPADWDDES